MIYRTRNHYYVVKGKLLELTNHSNYSEDIEDHYKCYRFFENVDFSLINSIDYLYHYNKFGLCTVFCRNSADMDIVSTIFGLL